MAYSLIGKTLVCEAEVIGSNPIKPKCFFSLIGKISVL
jgi:hypothetical protein